ASDERAARGDNRPAQSCDVELAHRVAVNLALTSLATVPDRIRAALCRAVDRSARAGGGCRLQLRRQRPARGPVRLRAQLRLAGIHVARPQSLPPPPSPP